MIISSSVGVNRTPKEWLASTSGANRKMQSIWARKDGVNRKMFSAGISAGSLPVGSIVKIAESGKPVDYVCIYQGLPNAPIYAASCNGTWLMRKSVTAPCAWGQSKNIYAQSSVNQYLNSGYLDLLSQDVRAIVKTVKIPFVDRALNSSGNLYFYPAYGLSTTAFLLSGAEVGYACTGGMLQDGSPLPYFSSDSTRIASNSSGVASPWWLRTPVADYRENSAWVVESKGDRYGNYINVDTIYGIRPAFIVSQDAMIPIT